MPQSPRICWTSDIPGFRITLEQRGPDRFLVRYGYQVDNNLDYATACTKLGQAIMHALACEGMIDNRTRAEARQEARGAREE